MIMYREWYQSMHDEMGGRWLWHGWFLFGVIPMYIAREGRKQ